MPPELKSEVISLAGVPADPQRSAPGPRQRVVLVVDDERVIADTVSMILSRAGFKVMTAYGAESAMELAMRLSPDLLLTDVMMGPGMDGTQLAIQMVKALPACRVLLFSGHAATLNLLVESRRQGHDFTLMAKPMHPAELVARVTNSFGCGEARL